MADKDMVERDIIAEKIPSAALMICLFHTLETFRREISVENTFFGVMYVFIGVVYVCIIQSVVIRAKATIKS